MINYIEVNDVEFVKKMYDEKVLLEWADWGEERYNKIYDNFKKDGFLKGDNLNFYVVKNSLLHEVYDLFNGKPDAWYVVLPSELNIDLDNNEVYLKITMDFNYGSFKVFDEMVDNYLNKDNPEYQKQSFIKYYKRLYKSPEEWAEETISAHSFHGPIDPDKVERIRSCKTWDDVYDVIS